MKKLFALVAVALTLCGLLTACGSKTETANDVDLTAFYNGLAEQYGWGDDMMDLDSDMLEMYYPEEELRTLAQAEQLLLRSGVVLPLYTSMSYYAVSSEVQGAWIDPGEGVIYIKYITKS